MLAAGQCDWNFHSNTLGASGLATGGFGGAGVGATGFGGAGAGVGGAGVGAGGATSLAQAGSSSAANTKIRQILPHTVNNLFLFTLNLLIVF